MGLSRFLPKIVSPKYPGSIGDRFPVQIQFGSLTSTYTPNRAGDVDHRWTRAIVSEFGI